MKGLSESSHLSNVIKHGYIIYMTPIMKGVISLLYKLTNLIFSPMLYKNVDQQGSVICALGVFDYSYRVRPQAHANSLNFDAF